MSEPHDTTDGIEQGETGLPDSLELVRTNFPAEILATPTWCYWDSTPRNDGRPSKMPIDPATGFGAKTSDPSTFGTFDAACDAALKDPRAGGVGCLLAGQPWIGMDFDHVVDLETGEVNSEALALLERLSPTYVEVSPSCDGLHVFLKGQKPDDWINQAKDAFGPGTGLEVYDGTDKRYFTATGDLWANGPIAAATVTDIEALAALMCRPKKKPTQSVTGRRHYDRSTSDEDARNLDRARFGLLELGLLDSDVDDEPSWFNTIVGLKPLGEPGRALAFEWSRRSSKFSEVTMQERWDRANGTSVNKLFGKFKEANSGWFAAYEALYGSQWKRPSRNPDDFTGTPEAPEWQSTDSSKTNAEVIDASVEAVIERFRRRGPMIHEPTDIAGIDDRTCGGPVYGTRFYILGAPDAGKTLLLAQIADTYLQRGIAVGFLASDEDSEDVLQRFLQRRGVTRAECEGQDGPALDNALRDVGHLPLRIYPRSYTIEQSAADLMAFAKAKGLRPALLMDSLQTIRCSTEDPDASTYVNVTKRVESIREVATHYNLIAMCTSEMSRGSYRSIRGADQSDMAAGKESGAIEYSARVMVALRSVPKESSMVELRFAKNKHGRVHREDEKGVFFMVHAAAQFLEEDPDYEPPTKTDSGNQKRSEQMMADVALVAVWIAEHPGRGVRQIDAGMKKEAGMGKERVSTARTYLEEIGALAVMPAGNNKKQHFLDGEVLDPEILDLIAAGKVTAVKASTPPVSERPGDTGGDTQESVLSGGVPGPPIGGRTHTTTAPDAAKEEGTTGTLGHSMGRADKVPPKVKPAAKPTFDDDLPEQPKRRRKRPTKTKAAPPGGDAT